MNSEDKDDRFSAIKLRISGPVLFLLAFFALQSARAQVTIDFENQTDSTVIDTQYSSQGVTFSGSPEILTAGVSLDESDFPPYSGQNVLSDVNGPIFGTFNAEMDFIGGYLTYTEPLTISVFNSSGTLLDTVESQYSANYASSGIGSPNEFISLSLASGFSSFEIEGDPNGGSFTMDDFTFTAESSGSTPSVPDSLGFSPIVAILTMIFGLDWLAKYRMHRDLVRRCQT